MHIENLILGAGVSGLATGQRLFEQNKKFLIIDKNPYVGGLCGSFNINGFVFDYFVHLSFTNNDTVRSYFDKINYIKHTPNPFNYYHGIWIKHPAQNNLFPLKEAEKKKIWDSLKKRDIYEDRCDQNYEYWLRYQFGDYFAEHFPMVYNRKYWGVETSEMETKWIGKRIYQPSIDEIKQGMETTETPVTYYAKEMRYPVDGGYQSYLHSITHPEKIRLSERVVEIDYKNHKVHTDKDEYEYDHLYSSIPLPEYLESIAIELPDEVTDSIKKLRWTKGALISFGLKGDLPREDLWDYIYDSDIAVSRIYSTSKMSEHCAPKRMSTLQAEIYASNDNADINNNKTKLLEETIDQLSSIGIFDKEQVVVKDIRTKKYANIIFDHNVYVARNTITGFLKRSEIIPIGRFGEWKYYWSGQSFLSGYNAVEE